MDARVKPAHDKRQSIWTGLTGSPAYAGDDNLSINQFKPPRLMSASISNLVPPPKRAR